MLFACSHDFTDRAIAVIQELTNKDFSLIAVQTPGMLSGSCPGYRAVSGFTAAAYGDVCLREKSGADLFHLLINRITLASCYENIGVGCDRFLYRVLQ